MTVAVGCDDGVTVVVEGAGVTEGVVAVVLDVVGLAGVVPVTDGVAVTVNEELAVVPTVGLPVAESVGISVGVSVGVSVAVAFKSTVGLPAAV